MNNDERIIELQKQIVAKREQLGSEPKLELVTNGVLKMGDGTTTDLRAMPQDVGVSLLVDLNCRRLSASDLGIEYLVGSFPVEDWVKDTQACLAQSRYNKKRNRLESLERKLERLLSKERQKTRAIEAIADEIRDDD